MGVEFGVDGHSTQDKLARMTEKARLLDEHLVKRTAERNAIIFEIERMAESYRAEASESLKGAARLLYGTIARELDGIAKRFRGEFNVRAVESGVGQEDQGEHGTTERESGSETSDQASGD